MMRERDLALDFAFQATRAIQQRDALMRVAKNLLPYLTFQANGDEDPTSPYAPQILLMQLENAIAEASRV